MLWLLASLVLASCGQRPLVSEEALATFEKAAEAWAASISLEAAGRGPQGDPEAMKAALMRAEDALAYWQRAATLHTPWPQARRNVERALLRVEALREHRANRTKKPEDEKPPEDVPEDPEEAKPPKERPVATKDLPPERVLGVLDLLQRREEAKRRLREAQRRAASSGVERDW